MRVPMADQAVVRLGRWLLTPPTFVFVIVVYLVVLFALRSLLFSGGSNDDSEQLLYSQSFQFGYGLRNPPLYTWLVIPFIHVFGVHLASVVLVKFVLLAGTYLLLLATAKEMVDEYGWAVAVAAAPLGMYGIGWDAVLNYSNTVLLMFVCVATFRCLLGIERQGGLLWYAAFGAALGAGILTKYTYPIFAVALIAAALPDAGYRRALCNRRIGIALAVAAIMLLPFVLYIHGHMAHRSAELAGARIVGVALSPIDAVGMSVWRVVTFGIGFLAPLILLLPLCFPGACRVLRTPIPASVSLLGRWLLIQTMIFLGYFFLAYALGYGAAEIRPHLFYIFILAPVWFIARARCAAVAPDGLPRFVALLAALALVVPVGMIVKVEVDPLTAKTPYFSVPYQTLAAALRANGFAGGTVFTWDLPYPLSGNLRPYLVGSRFVSGKYQFYQPPAQQQPGQCLAVWSADDAQATASFEQMFGNGAALPAQISAIDLPLVNGRGRFARFKYRLFPDGMGDCR